MLDWGAAASRRGCATTDLNLNPYILQIGGFGIRWYGFFMALSMAIGLYYFIRHGVRRGFAEDLLYNLAFAALLGGIAGARLVYVATNPGFYAAQPLESLRIDHGGLSWHGGLGGGLLAAWLYGRRRLRGGDLQRLADLAVPGLAVGYVLVRIGNIFNREVLGLPTVLFPFHRHPAQLYGSAIGILLLVLHNILARRHPDAPPGYLFWSFFFWYSVLRGAVEETFRDNPHYLVDVVNTHWGFGFLTLTQLFTPLFVLVSVLFLRASLRAGRARSGKTA